MLLGNRLIAVSGDRMVQQQRIQAFQQHRHQFKVKAIDE